MMRPSDVRECSMDMNSVGSSRRNAQVSTTCCPWVLMTRTLRPRPRKAALPRRAGMVIRDADAILNLRIQNPFDSVAQTCLSVPKRPIFCESRAFFGKKPRHRPPQSPKTTKKTTAQLTPGPGDTSPLTQPSTHPYHISQHPKSTRHPGREPSQCPPPSSANLAPPNPPTCSPKPRISPSRPSIPPPRPAQCPTWISGNERK